MANGHPPWTPEEDAIVLRTRSTKSAYRKLRGKRTPASILQHRYNLRHPQKATALRTPGQKLFTEAEKKILMREYPLATNIQALRAFLPRFTGIQIRSKAHTMGLKRWFAGDHNVPVAGHKELVDQIRIRAKQDGIPFYKLDRLLKSGQYFSSGHWRRNGINLVHVAHAIEFFGGTLVIDWCDR